MSTATTTAPAKRVLPNEGRPGYKHTKLGWIPEEWEVKPLGKIGKWRGGGTPSKAEKSYWNGEIPWVSSRDVKKRRLTDTELHISEGGLANSSSVLLPAGSLIVVTRSGILRHTLPACVNEVPMSINQDIKAMVPIRLADSDYVQMLFEGWNKYLLRSCYKEGTTVESIDFETLKSFRVPWPLEPERLRIVTVLGAWDRAIATAQQLLAAQQQRKRGLMQELLSGKKRFPGFEGKWKEVRLGELGTFCKGKGITKNDLRENGIPCVTYGELYTVHHVRIKKFRSFIDVVTADASQPIRKGDVLFAGSGETAEEIGKAAVYQGTERACAGGDVIILRPKGIDPLYLSYALSSSIVDAQRKKFGQGNSVVHIYPSQLAHMVVPVAPHDEQLRIIGLLSALDTEIELLESQIAHLTTQKRGLMQVLLTGEKRVNHD